MQSKKRVDGVLCFCDELAGLLIRGAMQAGRFIPADLAVVGVDGLPVSGMLVPSLTTLRQPTELLGQRAREVVNIVLQQDTCTEIVALAPELIVRESSCRQTV